MYVQGQRETSREEVSTMLTMNRCRPQMIVSLRRSIVINNKRRLRRKFPLKGSSKIHRQPFSAKIAVSEGKIKVFIEAPTTPKLSMWVFLDKNKSASTFGQVCHALNDQH